jgi:hypothetical protein
MRKCFAAAAALGVASSALAWPARADIIVSDAALAGKNFCWFTGWDSEQYGRDHSYVYSYHANFDVQFVIRGVWTIARDGAVTLKIDGGGTLVRRYEINGEHVKELTGSLGGGSDGHVC